MTTIPPPAQSAAKASGRSLPAAASGISSLLHASAATTSLLLPPQTATTKRKRGRPVGSLNEPGVKNKKKKPKVVVKPPPTEADLKVQAALDRKNLGQVKEDKAKASLARAEKALQKVRESNMALDDAYQQAVEEQADSKLESAAAAAAAEPAADDDGGDAESDWIIYYKSLADFKERVGHVRITLANDLRLTTEQQQGRSKLKRTLASWVKNQRKARRSQQLLPYQIVLLDRLGMVWKPQCGPNDGLKWRCQYDKLKAYKEAHGDCLVPWTYDDIKLAHWVKAQRSMYRNGLKGKKPILTQERIELLNELEFPWGEEKIPIPWDARFEELKQYKAEHGHANIPWRWSGNIPLAGWVVHQRNKYKDLLDGKQNNLTQERIQKLTDLGLAWSTGGTGRYDRSGEDNNSFTT